MWQQVVERRQDQNRKQSHLANLTEMCIMSVLSCLNLPVFSHLQKVHNMERSDIPGQALVRFMAKPPGFKDANFQVNVSFGFDWLHNVTDLLAIA